MVICEVYTIVQGEISISFTIVVRSMRDTWTYIDKRKSRKISEFILPLVLLMNLTPLNGAENGVSPSTFDEVLPTYVEAPAYPPLAFVSRVTGTVILDLIIDRNGKVQITRPLSGHPLLVDMSEKTASKWRFPESDSKEVTRQVRVSFVYNIVQGGKNTETLFSFFPPNRIEITKPLPETISYIPSFSLGELTEVICKVHHETMRPDKVPIVYGLLMIDETFSNAEEKEFPNANLDVPGGCILGSAKFAEVLYCSKCREAAARWEKQHTK